jgi:exosome complex component RRP46
MICRKLESLFTSTTQLHYDSYLLTIIKMAISAEPTALLSHLHRADGSATFSQNGYTVIGAVNGPIEVQRRDELPEEAAIDVVIRPAAGVGG